jgi:hypothetical protein
MYEGIFISLGGKPLSKAILPHRTSFAQNIRVEVDKENSKESSIYEFPLNKISLASNKAEIVYTKKNVDLRASFLIRLLGIAVKQISRYFPHTDHS